LISVSRFVLCLLIDRSGARVSQIDRSLLFMVLDPFDLKSRLVDSPVLWC
jgi:hypothetical protein